MFRGWYGTYMNPNDRPHTIRLYGSNNNSNYDLLIHLTGLNWSLNGANDYVNMVNYQEFIIPESNQGYYKYYKFELNSNASWTRFTEFALFSSDVGPAFVIPNVPEKNGIYASFYNTVTNPVVYSYSPIYTKMYEGETYFNGSGNLLDMNMNEVAMMGGGNRTFIATIKTTRSGVESRQFIFGYGSNLQSPDIESFGLYITNRVIDGGNGDNIYVLAAAGLDWFSNLKIYSNIEYTVAISYEGKASSGGWLYIYKKDSITGIWEMDGRRLSTHLWTTKGSNHNRHSDRGLAIGCFPYLGGTSTTHLPFFGTINNLTICNYLINTTNNLFTPNSTLNLSVSQKPSWLTLNNSETQLVGKPPRSNFIHSDKTILISYSTTITLSITNFQNETLNQTISIDVHAPPDYEDWSWKKLSYPSVATLYLDEPYHYFESERSEKDSVGKKVMTTQELNYIIQNSSRRFKFGTVMAIMYNIDIRTFRNYLGSTIWGDGRILWYIGTDASNRDGDDNDNMHMNFTHHRVSKNWSKEWMRPRMFYEGDECAFDFRVAREDQAFSRNYDWMIVTSWRDDGGSGSRHVISMSYRPHREYGLLGKNENGDSRWRSWGAGRWDGQNGGNNYKTDSGVPFWEDKIGHTHDGMWIGGIHRTDKPNRQFPYDCRVLVLKDYFHGYSDQSWRGGNGATQQSQINSVNPRYH